MKKTNLALAILLSLGVAACSSSGDDSPAPQPQPKEKPKPVDPRDKINPFIGDKSVIKNQSKLDVGDNGALNSNGSAKTTELTLEAFPTLDTLVVAKTKDNSVRVYLEDFDFRGNKTVATGEYTLNHIYKTVDGKTIVGDDRGNAEALPTKTNKMGKDTGKALVLDKASRVKYMAAGSKGLKDETGLRSIKDSVAEVYGARTFVDGDAKFGTDVVIPDPKPNNTPFVDTDAKGKAQNGRLEYVQYGRVTTRLGTITNVNAELAKGKELHRDIKTYLGSYADQGQTKTEDNYFYRTTTSAVQPVDTAALSKAYTDGKVLYQGHAVTSGLDHTFHESSKIPTAVGFVKKLESGTHVEATLNLADKSIKGSLYDTWSVMKGINNQVSVRNDLVDFSGVVNTKNGGIIGSSNLHYAPKNKGDFNAKLVNNATELGGHVKSDAVKNPWVGVFGAKATKAPVKVVSPAVAKSLLQESGDEKDKLVK